MIASVKHVSIPVMDYDRALAFYTETLGFNTLVDVAFGDGQRWIKLKIPNAETQIVLFSPEGHERQIGAFSNIVFSSNDVEKTYQDLLNKGVEFTVPPTEESWGIYCIFKDSEGNTFCLSSP